MPWILGGLAVVLVAAVVAGVLVFTGGDETAGTAQGGPAAGEAAPGQQADTPKGQQPGTIKLPEGGTATLVRRELTPDGTLPIPEGLDEATWWGAGLGASKGAALLSGHVNWKGKKGPFDELWRSRNGQEVSVIDSSGGQWLYKVTDIVTVHKDDLPAQAAELFGQDGDHRLVLVTCGGDYVGGTDGYRDNRIVTAELVKRP
ncbi:class F sortase [Amycolatopsis suaedae]|uniref:Class F sortase n=1 Tax=Amycolatopsis suaedae TaxID=2510978 RepID=A0A4Q7J249_9PSEU|nr:class F sortase [Amycolatopsis suaedae]RZQ60473.1 class F sortase [Amycolatopsis suaedae]